MKNTIKVKDIINNSIAKSRRLREGILKGNWDKIVGELCKKTAPLYIREKNPIYTG